MTTQAELLRGLALSDLEFEGEGEERCATEAIPRPLAQRLCAQVEAAGGTASWAPDAEDPDLAWVYIARAPKEADPDDYVDERAYEIHYTIDGIGFGIPMKIYRAEGAPGSHTLAATARTKREAEQIARAYERSNREERRDAEAL